MDRAVDMATNICTGNGAVVTGQLSPLLRILVTPPQVSAIYKSIIVPLGEFRSVESVTTNTVRGKTVVKVACRIGDSVQDVLVVYDKKLKVVGLRFLGTRRSFDYTAPAYVEPARFFDVDIRFGLPDWKLSGNLSVPANVRNYPVVIIIHGSGSVDRNGTIGAQMPTATSPGFGQPGGIAVIRYDKRSFLYSEKMILLTNLTLWDESVEDAVQAVKFALSLPDADPDRIFVVGHSLGATAAIRLVATTGNLRGCVLMAGPARPLEQLMAIQTLYLATNDGKYTFNERLHVAAVERQCRAVRRDMSVRTLPSKTPRRRPGVLLESTCTAISCGQSRHDRSAPRPPGRARLPGNHDRFRYLEGKARGQTERPFRVIPRPESPVLHGRSRRLEHSRRI
jgi:pimeloyl-ACP methyl ester carboxylesterase